MLEHEDLTNLERAHSVLLDHPPYDNGRPDFGPWLAAAGAAQRMHQVEQSMYSDRLSRRSTFLTFDEIAAVAQPLSTVTPTATQELLERNIAVIQFERSQLARALDEPAVLATPAVTRWTYQNPIALELLQAVPLLTGMGVTGATLLGVLKIVFGTGPGERAEAAATRAQLTEASGVEAPYMSSDVRRALRAIDPYDWEIE